MKPSEDLSRASDGLLQCAAKLREWRGSIGWISPPKLLRRLQHLNYEFANLQNLAKMTESGGLRKHRSIVQDGLSQQCRKLLVQVEDHCEDVYACLKQQRPDCNVGTSYREAFGLKPRGSASSARINAMDTSSDSVNSSLAPSPSISRKSSGTTLLPENLDAKVELLRSWQKVSSTTSSRRDQLEAFRFMFDPSLWKDPLRFQAQYRASVAHISAGISNEFARRLHALQNAFSNTKAQQWNTVSSQCFRILWTWQRHPPIASTSSLLFTRCQSLRHLNGVERDIQFGYVYSFFPDPRWLHPAASPMDVYERKSHLEHVHRVCTQVAHLVETQSTKLSFEGILCSLDNLLKPLWPFRWTRPSSHRRQTMMTSASSRVNIAGEMTSRGSVQSLSSSMANTVVGTSRSSTTTGTIVVHDVEALLETVMRLWNAMSTQSRFASPSAALVTAIKCLRRYEALQWDRYKKMAENMANNSNDGVFTESQRVRLVEQQLLLSANTNVLYNQWFFSVVSMLDESSSLSHTNTSTSHVFQNSLRKALCFALDPSLPSL